MWVGLVLITYLPAIIAGTDADVDLLVLTVIITSCCFIALLLESAIFTSVLGIYRKIDHLSFKKGLCIMIGIQLVIFLLLFYKRLLSFAYGDGSVVIVYKCAILPCLVINYLICRCTKRPAEKITNKIRLVKTKYGKLINYVLSVLVLIIIFASMIFILLVDIATGELYYILEAIQEKCRLCGPSCINILYNFLYITVGIITSAIFTSVLGIYRKIDHLSFKKGLCIMIGIQLAISFIVFCLNVLCSIFNFEYDFVSAGYMFIVASGIVINYLICRCTKMFLCKKHQH